MRLERGAGTRGEPRLNVLFCGSLPHLPPASAGAAAGRDFKMKLWDVVAVCLVLLHTASAFPLPAGKRPPEAPAEDRSLGRRRAPFALSSDCKNRSLPAGGAAGGPPRTPTRPHVPQASPMTVWPTDPRARGAGAEAPRGAWLPTVSHTPCLKVTRAGLPSTEGMEFLRCSFSILMNKYAPHQHHHLRNDTHSCPLFCFLIYTHSQFFFYSKALYLCDCAWLCLILKTIALSS